MRYIHAIARKCGICHTKMTRNNATAPPGESQPRAAHQPITGGNAPGTAPTTVFHTQVRFFADQGRGEAALRAHEVNQLLVVPADYLTSGRVRRYAISAAIDSRICGSPSGSSS